MNLEHIERLVGPVLHKFAAEHNARILWVWLAGSHAYELNSAASDVDVRFIYSLPLSHYVSLKRDMEMTSYVLNSKDSSGVGVDVSGWELSRSLERVLDTNPAIVEALGCPELFSGGLGTKSSVVGELKRLVENAANPQTLYHSYMAQARRTIYPGSEQSRASLAEGYPDVKSLLSVARCLLTAHYVQAHDTVRFPVPCSRWHYGPLSMEPKCLLKEAIEAKRLGKEFNPVDSCILFEHLKELYTTFPGTVKGRVRRPGLREEANAFLRSIVIGEHWHQSQFSTSHSSVYAQEARDDEEHY